jgi:ferredoxin
MEIVVVNRENCLGCGFCEKMCDDVFRMAEDGLAEVIGSMDEDNEDLVLAAIESCPVALFRLT